MKLKITYDEADIKRLVRNNLARQGITATDDNIELKKGQILVTVEASDEDEPIATAPAVPSLAVEQRVNHVQPSPPLPPPPPKLEQVEGGANPVDMSDVLGASRGLSRRDGPFPSPKQHSLLPGESFDFPGDET